MPNCFKCSAETEAGATWTGQDDLLCPRCLRRALLVERAALICGVAAVLSEALFLFGPFSSGTVKGFYICMGSWLGGAILGVIALYLPSRRYGLTWPKALGIAALILALLGAGWTVRNALRGAAKSTGFFF